jgi:hypothetical protein
MIRGEIRFNDEGKLKLVVYDEQMLQDMVKVMVGKDVIYKGKQIGKIIRADIIDGKILWEAEGDNAEFSQVT